MKSLALIVALSGLAHGQQQMTAPSAPKSVLALRNAFSEAVNNSEKNQALDQLARTAPENVQDLQALYDLFLRYPEERPRQAAVASLQLLDPRMASAQPILMRYLQDQEPESQLFGIKGILRLRSQQALPVIKKFATPRFKYKSAGDSPMITERNAWWVQYEALDALAQWEGPKALSLIKKKAYEAPSVARLMSLYLWKESLPTIVSWSGGSASQQALAQEALTTALPTPACRETREKMLALVRDPQAPAELRHQLALKAGICSNPSEVAALLKEYESPAQPKLKLHLAAVLFASRDPQIVPLLSRFAKEDPSPLMRAGARIQLKDMLAPADYRALLQWAAENDPDQENKQAAEQELGVRH